VKIHQEELSDVTRYLERHREIPLEDKEDDFALIMGKIKAVKPIDEHTEILEIGVGTGWIPILCKKKGLRCKGIEISPQLVEFAYEYGRKYGIEPDIELANIENAEIGESRYDVIIATSVFEHVEHWRQGLERIYRALRPGGAFFFLSTNRLSLRSEEYHFPLYGWLPDSWRYRLRVWRQGEDIMKLGIDFNQFTYPLLRRAFKELGYSKIYDRLDLLCLGSRPTSNSGKKRMLCMVNRIRPLRHLVLLFSPGTVFICTK